MTSEMPKNTESLSRLLADVDNLHMFRIVGSRFFAAVTSKGESHHGEGGDPVSAILSAVGMKPGKECELHPIPLAGPKEKEAAKTTEAARRLLASPHAAEAVSVLIFLAESSGGGRGYDVRSNGETSSLVDRKYDEQRFEGHSHDALTEVIRAIGNGR